MKTLRDAVSAYTTIARAEGKSEHTIAFVRDAVRFFNDFLGDAVDLDSIAVHDVRRWIVALRERPRFASHPTTRTSSRRLSPTTINNYVRGVRLLFSTLVREELIEDHPVARVRAPKAPTLTIEPLSDAQLAKVFEALGATRHPLRERAIVGLLWDSCLRVSEAIGLLSGNVHLQEREIKVMGKGLKERVVPLSSWTAKQLLLYEVRERPQTDSDRFFVDNDGQPFEPWVIQQTLKRIGGRLGIRCNPHTFRHTGALGMVREGLDPLRLQRMLGHEDLSMTRRYVKLGDVDLKQIRRFSPGDRLRL